MKFSPVNASKEITDSYKRYLKTMFEISDEEYYSQLISQLDDERTFAAGPYIDVTDSFVTGKCLSEMVEEGILPKNFTKINMHTKRPLYKHQEVTVLKAVQGKNIVVSTGTGSGKTECFLIPIFRQLVAEHAAGTLSPGVRALLIYPMNALANDQVERLRDLLIDYPEITFGCYTGQTRNKYSMALEEYRALNNNQEPRKNELISRDQMKETPPNILITNYAMLEYLMIRPEDSVFFERKYAKNWRFIVLDEAHVYNGSTGIEVSMLLSRLKAKLENSKIQYVLTSATLGGDEDNAEVARFAGDLCRSFFDKDDVIRAQRVSLAPCHGTRALPTEFYDQIANSINIGCDDNVILQNIAPYLEQDLVG
ncbi:MAG: DEAD/DEAH box helicase, partial [Clostridiales bacterium]|nr:DEAD/DEAH box helicase [Clostridiales bacterium]